MSTSLSSQVPIDSLKTIASALPSSLADKVISSQVEQVFIWVIKDSENAAKIVSILQDAGFTNIQVDSKGNTITAQAGGLINNTPVDEPISASAPETTTTSEPTSSTFGATAASCAIVGTLVGDCSKFTSEADCQNLYIPCHKKCDGTTPAGGTLCKWSAGICNMYDYCTTCPPKQACDT
jgi:hypothetical protein